ncbi:GGDEF domain-containing protein [Roseibium sp.]|uniref:GGDEF domain-containing protein n=1 Tax=Roseibium sp. TaxID=1936156 RepID=UPI003A97806C
MSLDTPTLFSAITLAYLTGAVLMAVLALSVRGLPSSVRSSWLIWAVALALSAGGTYMVGQRGAIPAWMSITVANALVLASFGLRPNSLSLLTRNQFAYLYLPLTAVGGWLALNTMSWFADTISFRVVFINSFCLLSSALCIREALLLRKETPISGVILIVAFACDMFARTAFILSQLWLHADNFLATFQSTSLKLCLIGLMVAIVLKMIGLGLALFEKLQWNFQRLADRDPLTLLYNQKGLQSIFSEASDPETETPGHGALIVLEITDFSKIRKRYGNSMGEAVLRLIAQTCRELLEQPQQAAHLHTNHFVLMFPGATTAQANSLLHRIRLCLQLESNLASQHKLPISVDAGVALYASGASLPEILNEADQNLRTGREQKTSSPLASESHARKAAS